MTQFGTEGYTNDVELTFNLNFTGYIVRSDLPSIRWQDDLTLIELAVLYSLQNEYFRVSMVAGF